MKSSGRSSEIIFLGFWFFGFGAVAGASAVNNYVGWVALSCAAFVGLCYFVWRTEKTIG